MAINWIEANIHTMYDDGFKGEFRYSGTYLHGQIETDHSFDIFSFDRSVGITDDGIYYFLINGRECLYYIYKVADHSPRRRMYQWRGFLVYRDDEDAVNDALAIYLNKEEDI